jgi:hypothetical protein
MGRTEAVLDELRLAVYRGFATTGRAPSVSVLARELGLGTAEVQTGLGELAQRRHLVLDVYGSVVMAHPFAAVPLGFSVMGGSTLWWGGCAWDSFALPNLLHEEGEVLVATRCPACDRPHAWDVGHEHPPQGSQVAHFLVPVQHLWDDVVHSCRNQRIFCAEECVAQWLARTGQQRGYVMDLTTLWNLASHWYDGRLGPGYQRREPDDAADYLRGVGLTGPFWGG